MTLLSRFRWWRRLRGGFWMTRYEYGRYRWLRFKSMAEFVPAKAEENRRRSTFNPKDPSLFHGVEQWFTVTDGPTPPKEKPTPGITESRKS